MIVSFTLQSVDELVMRNFNYCVIDEVDSILIDEARTPLIISGPAEKPSDQYYKAAKVAAAFERDIHYTVRIDFCQMIDPLTNRISAVAGFSHLARNLTRDLLLWLYILGCLCRNKSFFQDHKIVAFFFLQISLFTYSHRNCRLTRNKKMYY